ncbi:MAG: serine/threonine-protein kinase [Myxococcota bacterium]
MSSDDVDQLDALAGAASRRLAAVLGGEPTADELRATVEGGRLARGARIGDYAILGELGAGGMGLVYLAERADGSFERRVALKLLRGVATEAGRMRLLRERKILAGLDHPAISRLLDGGTTADGQPFLVMELVEGQNLLAYVADRRLDRAARIALWRSIAEGVAHAHQRLIVHRDIKPGNVLVRSDGAPKLLDFGIAKLLDATDEGAQPSTRIYTPGYAAPEQLAGGQITTRTDVHALGTLLEELLSARRGDGTASSSSIAPVPIDRDLRAILRRARAEDPLGRYPTVDALLEDVERLERGLPVRARGDNTWYAARKLLWRLRAPLIVLALALVALVGFVVELKASRDDALAAKRQAQEAQASAETAAARAKALLSFVGQIFEEAAPENTMGRTMTPRDLLQAAEARIADADPKDRPAILFFLGGLYAELGDRSETIRLVANATTALGAPRDANEGRWMVEALFLAGSQLGSVDPARAVAAATQAVELRRRWAKDDPGLTLTASVALGSALHHAEEHERAIEILLPAATATPTGGRSNLETITDANHTLAGSAAQLGDVAQVEAAVLRMRKLMSAIPADSPHQSYWLQDDAQARTLRGDYAGAIARLEEAVALLEKSVRSGIRLAAVLNELGVVANTAGQFTVSARAIERAVALTRSSAPPEELAQVLVNLAGALESNGEYLRSLEQLREALRLGGEAWAEPYRLRAESNLGRVLALLGRYEEARRILTRVQARQAEIAPASGIFDALRLAQLELSAGRPDAAARWLDHIEPKVRGNPELGPFARMLRRARARVRYLRGDAGEAVAMLDALIPEYQATFGDAAFDTDLIRLDRAEALTKAGRSAEARGLVADLLPRLRRAVGPGELNLRRAEALASKLGV